MRRPPPPWIPRLLRAGAGVLAATVVGAALAAGPTGQAVPTTASPLSASTSVAGAPPAGSPTAAAGSALAAGPASDSAESGPAEATPAPTAPAESAFVSRVRDKASDMVLTAMNFLGVPYHRGGQTVEQGFDCSGLTRKVFETSLGLVLPRRADEQAKAAGLVAIRREELRPGDLVFFNTLRRTFSHVGIYIGDGKFIHAPRTGAQVRIEDLRFVYWAKRFTGARRVDGVEPEPADIPVTPSVSALAPTYAVH